MSIVVTRAEPKAPPIEKIRVECSTFEQDNMEVVLLANRRELSFRIDENGKSSMISMKVSEVPAFIKALEELADQ